MFEFFKDVLTHAFSVSPAVGIAVVFSIIEALGILLLLRYIFTRPDKENDRLKEALKTINDFVGKLSDENKKILEARNLQHAQEVALNTAHFEGLLEQKDKDSERSNEMLRSAFKEYSDLVRTMAESESASMDLVQSVVGSLRQVTESITALFGANKADHDRIYSFMEMHLSNIEKRLDQHGREHINAVDELRKAVDGALRLVALSTPKQ